MLKDLCSHGERSIAWLGLCMEVVWLSVTSRALVNCSGVASLQLFGNWAVRAVNGGSCSGKRKKDAQMFYQCCPSRPCPSFCECSDKVPDSMSFQCLGPVRLLILVVA